MSKGEERRDSYWVTKLLQQIQINLYLYIQQYRFFNRKPSVFSDKCGLGVNCFELLKPDNQSGIGNDKRYGAKAEKTVGMA